MCEYIMYLLVYSSECDCVCGCFCFLKWDGSSSSSSSAAAAAAGFLGKSEHTQKEDEGVEKEGATNKYICGRKGGERGKKKN